MARRQSLEAEEEASSELEFSGVASRERFQETENIVVASFVYIDRLSPEGFKVMAAVGG